MKKTLLSALLLSSLAGAASAQVANSAPTDRYFDAATSAVAFFSPSTVSAPITGTGNIQMGAIIDMANFIPGRSIITGLDVPIGNLTGTAFTAAPVRLSVWMWNTVGTPVGGGTAPLFSNQVIGAGGPTAPTLVLNLAALTLDTGFIARVTSSFPALTVAPTTGSRLGVSFKWEIDQGAGFVTLPNMNTSVCAGATQVEPATGTNVFGPPNGGYLRSANSDIDVNGQFATGSGRQIAVNSVVPFAIYGDSGVIPVVTGACCIAGIGSVKTAADCATNGGTYLGDNTSAVGTGTNVTSGDSFPISVPDFVALPAVPVFSTVTTANPATITSLAVNVGLTQTFVGDFAITLTNGATVVNLFNSGANAQAVNGVYTFSDVATTAFGTGPSPIPSGEYKPAGTLADFNGLPAAGTWVLTVSDNGAGDVGTIDSFELVINPSACGGPACTADIAGGVPSGGDGIVDGSDFIAFINAFGEGTVVPPATSVADINRDGIVDGNDFVSFINAFGAGC